MTDVTIKTKGIATVKKQAFSGCSSLDHNDVNIDASETHMSNDAFDGGDNGGKGGSSSNKDDDSEGEETAKTLGNIQIRSVYLGTSPNIYVNLNFFMALMKKARKIFGHILPSPDFIHSAIWISDDVEPNDESYLHLYIDNSLNYLKHF